jgi:ATP-dependent DNA helicase UvrD/PcrA
MAKNSLNPEQVTAVTHGDGPLLIIAGAGTGKTTVITQRIAHLILERKISPSNILALTFTDKAAAEMEERIDVVMPYGFPHMWIETFHGFCERILKQEAIHIGLDANYRLATEAEIILFIRKNLFKFHLEYFRPLGNPTKFIQAMLHHFSRLQDEDITPEQYLHYAKELSQTNSPIADEDEEKARQEEIKKTLELANAYKTFQELKIQEGIMDFSDLISNTLQLFRTRKNILLQYQKQFQYILIDEFQDTNFAQNQLALLLAGERKNITVVGDDDQAIYRWRGAAISNMMQFKKHFPDTTIVTLTKNYRSTQNILDASYIMIQQNNPDRLEVQENINKKLQALRNIAGEEITLLLSDRGDNEAELVVKKIEELRKKKKYGYHDFAILVRANDHAQPFLRIFDRMKIPYQFLGPGQLFHQEEIKDLISYLKILVNYEDTPSVYRVFCMPIFALSGTTIATLLNTAKKRHMSLFALLAELTGVALPDTEKETVIKIYEMITKHLALISQESAGQILYYFLQETGMLQKMVDPQSLVDEKQAQNIARFFEKLKKFETEQEERSVFAVVDWIELSMQMGESPMAASVEFMDTDAVNILTVHSSKGLEFPVVFLVNLIKDRFPSRERKEQLPIPPPLFKEQLPEGDYHIQEERRLFYVAMTRAKDMLFLAASKIYGEGKRERKLSPFIAESLGLEIVEKIQQKKTVSQLSLLDLFPQTESSNDVIPNGQRPKTKITYLSYSQMQTFDVCPLHYKLRYVLKIPTPQTPALSFGVSVHAVLRDFYQRHMAKISVSHEEIEELLKKNWIIEGYTSREHEQMAYKRALTVIEKYVQEDFKENTVPLALELPFEFYVQNPETKQGFWMGGRIDRIDKKADGTIEIIDYKTGSNVPDEKELAKNFQLTTYALAASLVRSQFFNKTPDQVHLSLSYVEENKKFTTTRTKEQLEEAKLTLLSKAEEIANSDFLCSTSIFCKNCEYKMLCKTEN